jgi:hypothetical protein
MDQWTGINVDLSQLTERLVRFFEGNQFDTKLEQNPSRFVVYASNQQFRVKVNVRGEPNDFKVEFIPSTKTQGFSVMMLLGYVTTLFGGGTFMLRDIKLQEAINRLEKVFWKEVDIDIADLSKQTATG